MASLSGCLERRPSISSSGGGIGIGPSRQQLLDNL
ncbi:hypothetical protein VD0002_g9843 [Verticillium dahliae]|uniref:Uncharacterized protein n=1 Tax=Verticillium dahliae TaxID=27337 RepID=A0AA44WPF2_VERDA|nr:hypothetical protein BJF96_g1933 [Verticillium dahliae]PNH41138.1 hypothetical protein VD0003_g10009 [Verticillium dahliae]PNH55985.1 hypothetical protein VD0002_g9843 [Verticillium dahliae]